MSEDELDRLREKRRKQLMEEASRPETPDELIPIGDREDFDEVLDRYPRRARRLPRRVVRSLRGPRADDRGAGSRLRRRGRDRRHRPPSAIVAERRVRSVPTLLSVVDGRPVERLVGVRDRGTLSALIDRYLERGDTTSTDG
jgi:hypothetical protein